MEQKFLISGLVVYTKRNHLQERKKDRKKNTANYVQKQQMAAKFLFASVANSFNSLSRF